jgi:hypothetical protein
VKELTPEERKAQTAAKRKAIEALHDTYEAEIAKLGATEEALLVDRLISLRENAIADIPARFELKVTGLYAEADKLVNQLKRYLQKLEAEADQSTEERLADADLIKSKAAERIKSKAKIIADEMDEYGRAQWTKEQEAIDRAYQVVQALVAKAQGELGFGWTWLADVRVVDWQRMSALLSKKSRCRH